MRALEDGGRVKSCQASLQQMWSAIGTCFHQFHPLTCYAHWQPQQALNAMVYGSVRIGALPSPAITLSATDVVLGTGGFEFNAHCAQSLAH